MAANYKVLFFFEGVQAAKTIGTGADIGWVEQWYLVGASDDISVAILDFNISGYIAYRQASLAPIYKISFVRISNEAVPRLFKVQSLDGKFGQNGQGTPAQVQCAILIDMSKGPVGAGDKSHHRRFLMRGLPSDVITGNVLNTGVPAWKPIISFLDFVAFHQTNQAPPKSPGLPTYTTALGIRLQNPATKPSNLTNVAAGSNARMLLVQPPVPPPANPQTARYRVSGVPGPNQNVNRVWPYRQNDPGPPADTMLGPARRDIVPSGMNVANVGKIQFVDPLYALLDQYVIIGLRNKRTGRIFRQLRGRSRSRT